MWIQQCGAKRILSRFGRMYNMVKTFLIETTDVTFLDENNNVITIKKYPVFTDEFGKYIEISFFDTRKQKYYLDCAETDEG